MVSMQPTSLLVVAVFACPVVAQEVGQPSARVAPEFVANRGQWPEEVRFRYRSGPATAWVHDDGMTLSLVRYRDVEPRRGEGIALPHRVAVDGVALRFFLEGAVATPPRGRDASPTRRHFAVGSPTGWARDVPGYAAVVHDEPWPGARVEWLTRGGLLSYDLHFAAGSDGNAAVMRVEGAESMRVDERGGLVVATALGDLRLTAPRSLERAAGGDRAVASRFVRLGAGRYRIDVDRVDRDAPLWIDPGIEWATFLGGVELEDPLATRVDDAGRIYFTGYVENQDFPTTTGVFQPGNAGVRDMFIACVDPGLTGSAQVVWSTHLGGSAQDVGYDLHVPPSGEPVTVAGITNSPNFPVTAGAFQTARSGTHDAVIAQLTSDGSVLAYSTYFGGNEIDRACALRVDSAGRLVLGGYTSSLDLPTTAGVVQPNSAGNFDGFVAVLDPSAIGSAQLVRSTYLGGGGAEGRWVPEGLPVEWDFMDIHLDASDSVTFVGVTNSTGYPTTAGAYQTTFGGFPRDLVVTRLDAALTAITYSTFLGGSGDEQPVRVAPADNGALAICGVAWSADFPTTAGAYQSIHGGASDGFAVVLDPNGQGASDLRYSTLIGGGETDPLSSIYVESSGILVAAGTTEGGLVPTVGAMQTEYSGNAMGYLLRLDPAGNGSADMHYLTYVGAGALKGGFLWEGIWDLEPLPDGRLVATAWTDNPAFALTPGAFQTTYGGGDTDVVVLRADLIPDNMTRIPPSTPACAGPIDVQANQRPQPGAVGFELICNDVPPNASGWLLAGVPRAAPLPVLNIEFLVQIVAAPGLVAGDGFVRTPLPIPVGFPAIHPPIAFQYVWLTTPACPGSGPLASSDAITFEGI